MGTLFTRQKKRRLPTSSRFMWLCAAKSRKDVVACMKRRASAARNNITQQKGSVLTWAIVILLVLTVLVGAVLTLSLSYYTRSMNNNSLKQAYFTARSAVNAIAQELCGSVETANGQAMLAKLPSNGDLLEIPNIQFDNNQSDMGTCKAVLKRESYHGLDTILITATATVGSQTESVSLRLQQKAGFSFPDFGDATLYKIAADTTAVIYGDPNRNYYVQKDSTVKFASNANYDGIIYAETNAVISITQGAKFQFSGKIYLQSGTIIQYNKLHKQFVGSFYAQDGSVITINDIKVTVMINQDGTLSFSPSHTGLTILNLFRVDEWNLPSKNENTSSAMDSTDGNSSENTGGNGTAASSWSILQYEQTKEASL